MNQLTPEQLKVVAEGMGKEAFIKDGFCWIMDYSNGSEYEITFYPSEENHSQFVEVMIWLPTDVFMKAYKKYVSGLATFEHAILITAWEVAKKMKDD